VRNQHPTYIIRTPSLVDAIRAGRALFLAALLAIPIGVAAGILAGLLFFGIGALYGAIVGVPIGFLAALFGGAIGKRSEWMWSGILFGAVGGVLAMWIMGSLETFILFAVVIPAIAGGIAGWNIGDRLENTYVAPRGLIGGIDRLLYYSPLYSLPLPTRLAIAAFEAVPVVGILIAIMNR